MEVDQCAKCQGVWLDDGEIAQLIGAVAVRPLPIPRNAVEQQGQLCPRCRKPLFLFSYPGTATVIDVCQQCAGIWLDAGELQEIAKVRRERTMICPSCGHQQPVAESCAQCGIVIRKFVPRAAPQRQAAAPLHSEIGGIKGTLIRFVDNAMATLWTGIRG
jgi:Zn-finger nucleic acid-binding protein